MEVIRIHRGKMWRDSGFFLFKPRAMRIIESDNMKQLKLISNDADDKPILESLTPAWAQKWEDEGLFKRTQFCNTDIRPARKKRFIINLRAAFYDTSHNKEPREIKGNSYINPMEISFEQKNRVIKQFDFISDPKMREIMALMILSQTPAGAQYTARKNKMAWEQFKIDFNYGLYQIMEATGNA